MLIYLNRTGFNGLFRLNARGEFNVPAGRYERPKIADREKLARVAEALSGARLRLRVGIVRVGARDRGAGDFVYFDPPYAPLSRTANFTVVHRAALRRRGSAAAAADRDRAGARAAATCCSATRRPTRSRRSTSATPTRAAAGLRAIRVPARRAINSNAARRGPVDEYLITNVAPADTAA